MKQDLEYTWGRCPLEGSHTILQRQAIVDERLDVDQTLFHKAQGGRKGATPRANDGHFVHDNHTQIKAYSSVKGTLEYEHAPRPDQASGGSKTFGAASCFNDYVSPLRDFLTDNLSADAAPFQNSQLLRVAAHSQ
jgi:hypothetical protein